MRAGQNDVRVAYVQQSFVIHRLQTNLLCKYIPFPLYDGHRARCIGTNSLFKKMMPIRENPENGLGSPQMVSINDPLVALVIKEAQPTPQKGGRQYSTNSSGTQIRESGRDDTVVSEDKITLADLPGREHLPYYDVYKGTSFNPHHILKLKKDGCVIGYYYFDLVLATLFRIMPRGMVLFDVFLAEDRHVDTHTSIVFTLDEDKQEISVGDKKSKVVFTETDGVKIFCMCR